MWASLDVVIMAAGKGTRMKSARPKVLHQLGGRPLLGHVVEAVVGLKPRRVIVVTGHGAIEIEAGQQALAGAAGQFAMESDMAGRLAYVRQEPQLGTGHAVQQAAPMLGDDGLTLVLNGDVPLIRTATLQALVQACAGERLALLTLQVADASGYGRILRDAAGAVQGIVEHKDATPEQRRIGEFYTGSMAAPTRQLKAWLAGLTNRNAQGEYYLTDVVAAAVAGGTPVVAVQPQDADEVAGVNSPVQLAELERALQRRRALALMEAGVRLADPARFDLRGTLVCGTDVEIDVNCVFEGQVSLGDGVHVGANCVIANATIAAGAVIHPMTHIDGGDTGVTVGEDAIVGPFARLRPGAQLGAQVHIGNFVEVKNATLARGAKANHLAYLGDAAVGERVNYGAGAITANYDGANKHRTVIGADVHVGSNAVLVAPVNLGAGGTVGAGSVISKDAPDGALSVARGRQVNIANWKRPAKKPKS
ncbi:MAG: bifunctional UDP-N-acetylglucosamine diphosphorylase/glucosamine-1-phosphate N-acetyltransferase GlmU [Ramlibacter sp.]|jgi:bifunctional UDP-N-acetylglucosamine pyrophosphorylase/glucosamine-1-phosphate N-acetyltransferase|nr:bifunctional UDP-N-acetylglucosamine diphosphorylase/glucosamine-1-phosphate N-acetyltransferase GlmU [Ramlibacter sp.]